MRIRLLSFALAVAGALLLAWGLPREGGELYFVVVFPVLVLRGPLSALGAFLLFFGVFLGFFSLVRRVPARLFPPAGASATGSVAGPQGVGESSAQGREGKRRFGGVLLLGPVPIVFGSGAKVTTAMLILALALTTLLVLVFLWRP